MSMLDSTATFKDYLSRLGLSEFEAKFTGLGFTTLGEFAFSANYTPGAADDSQFLAKVATPILGAGGAQKIPALRRLFFFRGLYPHDS